MKKKRLLALGLSALMIVSMLPMSAFAKIHYREDYLRKDYHKYYKWTDFNHYLPNVLEPTKATVPDNVLVNPVGNKLKITWDKVDGADSYALYQKTKGDYKLVKTLSDNEFVTGKKKNNVTYYYKVRAITNGNYSDYSYWVSAQTEGSKKKNATEFVRRGRVGDINGNYLASSDNKLFVSPINGKLDEPRYSTIDQYSPILIKLKGNPKKRVDGTVRIINHNSDVLKLGLPQKCMFDCTPKYPYENYVKLYQGVGVVAAKGVYKTGMKYGDVLKMELMSHNGTKATVLYVLSRFGKRHSIIANTKDFGGISDISKYVDGSYKENPDDKIVIKGPWADPNWK